MQKRIIFTDLLFAILIFILLFVSYLSYQRINDLIEAADLVNHTNTVKIKLRETYISIADAETGQRGYLITKDTLFLQPYSGAFEQTQATVAELDSLMEDYPEQQQNLSALKVLIKKKFDMLNLFIQLSYDSTQQMGPLLDFGRNIMDSVRIVSANMMNVEKELLQKRMKEKEHHANVSPILSLVLVVATLLIVILAFLKIRKTQSGLNLMNEQLINRDKLITAKNLELESTNTELSSFTWIASHDLQEPLRKIQVFSERIIDKDGDQLSDNAKDYFNRINAAAQHMQNLIKSLLIFSQTSITEKIFEKVDLNKTLHDVEELLKDSITKKDACIESDHLPTINAVRVQIHQLFLNLIGNSLKYSKADVAPHIKITAEKVTINEVTGRVNPNGYFWKIIIRDNGIGFEHIYEHKIFEPFQRLHGKTEYEGTGIGLAICKKILQSHNGTISATGQPNIGSTFTFFLSDNNKS